MGLYYRQDQPSLQHEPECQRVYKETALEEYSDLEKNTSLSSETWKKTKKSNAKIAMVGTPY